MILIAYDGSDDAKSAIQHAGELMPGQPAVVVTIWEPYLQMITRYPSPTAMLAGEDNVAIDAASQADAEQTAEEGAALARSHGLDATSRIVARRDSIAETLLGEADHANASAIVTGSRGLGGLGSLFLGSVSHALLQRADRAVIVVPSPRVAQKRNEKLRNLAEA
jgi:nucleotide-binding universal stress UspA family protein